ncbi:MAG: hypothetical protein RSF90_01250, partial [Pygmaiobacter sp.]
GGHLIANETDSFALLQQEWASPLCGEVGTTPLGHFARVHLRGLAEQGLSPKTLHRIFMRAAATADPQSAAFRSALDCFASLAETGVFPFSAGAARDTLAAYRAAGCPAVRHSECYRAAYHPAYRVVGAPDAAVLPLLCAIDALLAARPRVLISIDGGAASGKSTLGAYLAALYDANLYHMDDFFLRAAQRTPARLAEIGGNLDRERFAAEVLTPLTTGAPVSYRRFTCADFTLSAPVTALPKRLEIIEGAYANHPAFGTPYDLRVFLTIAPATQRARILQRNGTAMLRRFTETWIPMENAYFAMTKLADTADILLCLAD